jgi:hypothetical protein
MSTFGPTKLAITSSSGKVSRGLIGTLGQKGSLIAYNSETSSISNGVDFTMAGAIFKDIKLCGFDLMSWATSNREEVQRTVDALTSLFEEKKIVTPPFSTNFFNQNNFSKAVATLESTGGIFVMRN